MAQGFPLPPPLSLSQPDSLAAPWKAWRRQWDNYMIATGLREKNEDVQVATLLTCLGSEALNVLDGLCPNEDDQKKLSIVLAKFEEFCVGTKNETFERYKFNSRNQENGESIELYVAELRKLAKSCNYRDLEESLIRDRVVLGVPDVSVRKRLLQEQDLDLTKAVAVVKAHEATQKQMRSIDNDHTSDVHAVRVHKRHSVVTNQTTAPVPGRDNGKPRECKFCGRLHPFKKESCPAWGKACQACGRRNHFATKCRYAEVRLADHNALSDNDEQVNQRQTESTLTLEIGALTARDSGKLFAHLLLGGDHLQQFQLDTGATANIIPQHVYKKACKDHRMKKLKQCNISLVMFNKTTTKVMGKALIEVINPKNGSRYDVEFLVVREDLTPLIGVKTLQSMDLIEVKSENIAFVNGEDQENEKACENRSANNEDIHKHSGIPDGEHCKDIDLPAKELYSLYSDVFTGVGKLPGKLRIQTDETVRPVQLPARSVPEAVKMDVKAELDKLVKDGIISTVSEPTEWVSAMVVVKKPTKGIRICIDPKPLNKAIKRNHYPLPTVEDLTPALAKAKVFSVCDAKSGYWHVELDTPSSYLTTFATPWGRYRWRRLPFGLCLASEEFQRRLNMALEGLEGVMAIADDILVYGMGASHSDAVEDHDRKLTCLLERCRQVGLKLNIEKMKLRQQEVKYMGHMFTADGLRADPDKIQAVLNMPAPEDRKGVQRILGLVNYLQRFAPNLAEASAPLRALLKKENAFIYEEAVHGRALDKIKNIITRDPVLKYYDVNADVVVQVDSSCHGLGACLMQDGHPVAYASRALNETEKNYAQIEKEMLAIVYGLNKFERYTLGKKTTVESDHKPLETIIKKDLGSAPKRLQRMMLQLQKYDFDVMYKRGQEMYVADTLSRAHGAETSEDREKEHVCPIEELSYDEVEIRSMNDIEDIPVSDKTTQLILKATIEDDDFQDMIQRIRNGWPDKKALPDQLRPYYSIREELSTKGGLVLRGARLVVPKSIRQTMKERVHSSHIGLQGCIRRAREAIYWPGMTQELENFISRCTTCMEYGKKQPKEELKSHDVPNRPWQNIACDMMEFKGRSYLVTVDTYSDFIECDRLSDKRANEVIRVLKSQMARHGIAEKVMTDNGQPFSSSEFRQFATNYEFKHQTSSPGYPQSNGKAESAVKILKNLMIKAEADGRDVYLALLDWRNTPTEGIGSSPAQRLFGRRTRTLLPTSEQLLKPETVRGIPSKLAGRQQRQSAYYNKGAKNLPWLRTGDRVYMAPAPGQNKWRPASVIRYLGNRSYLVQTDDGGGIYRRNRRHLRRASGSDESQHQAAAGTGAAYRGTPAVHEGSRLRHSGSTAAHSAAEDDYMYIPVPSSPSPQPGRSATQQVNRSPYLLRSRARVS